MLFTRKNFSFSDFMLKKNVLLQKMVWGGWSWTSLAPRLLPLPLSTALIDVLIMVQVSWKF